MAPIPDCLIRGSEPARAFRPQVLVRALDAEPHSLEAVDITDAMHKGWWDKYKYDIPVLHIDGEYWAKHRCASRPWRAAVTLTLRVALRAHRQLPPTPSHHCGFRTEMRLVVPGAG